ncbi:aminotransferase class V-fold PLP-dependent enzyme [Streptomyces sp. NPDC056831]|uniref:aminotransferase class V-fold PLP-dependent enzyme n=1 Tax=Streptomyces sp. NPDC056831 TaxID=3345954 RepID=UPI0036A8F329
MDILSELLPHGFSDYVDKPVSQQFPGSRASLHRFDSPGGTLMHAAVCDAMAAYLRSPHVANDGGAFPQSVCTDALEEQAHQEVLALFHTPDGTTVFGANMTTLTALFVRALRATLRPGDDIVCTALDHEANRHPWMALSEGDGVRVRIAEAGRDGRLESEDLVRLIGPRTRWVAITAASNALGTVPDLPAVIRAAHAAGARVFVDAVQSLAHRPLDVSSLGCDAVVTSAYKWYGPHVSVLWISEETGDLGLRLPEQVPSAGGTTTDRLSLGTWNHEGLVGLTAAARLLQTWPATAIAAEEQRLHGMLLDGLRDRPWVRVFGRDGAHPTVPVVAFQVEGEPARRTASRLAEQNVSVWDGSFYAEAALRAVCPEHPEAVRAGIAAYTTEDDVAALLDALDNCR